MTCYPPQESVRRYLRHLLGISCNHPIQDWPKSMDFGELQLNLDLPNDRNQDDSLAGWFAEKYIEEYNSGNPVCSISFVAPDLITPGLVRQAFLDHVKYVCYAHRHPSTPSHLQNKRRKQRKRNICHLITVSIRCY